MVKGITYRLATNAGVRTITGLNKAGDKYKVYPNVCPEPEIFPYIVVRQSGKTPFECKGMVADTFEYRYDVYSYHQNYEDVEAMDAAVLAALPLLESTTINGVDFQEIRFVNTVDAFDQDYQLHVKISTFEAMV